MWLRPSSASREVASWPSWLRPCSLTGSAPRLPWSAAVSPGERSDPEPIRREPAWSHAGEPVPHLARMGDDWDTLLADPAALAAAEIPVEHATSPLLLMAGEDDRTWPSARLSAYRRGSRREARHAAR